MRGRPDPLLCELHAHTRWSDGVLTVAELVDLYGRNGFDVLCVTDHVLRSDDPWAGAGSSVDATSWGYYLAEIEREAARALGTYGMVVLPGLELTYNDSDPAAAAHAIALGLHSFVSVDGGITEAIQLAVEAGAAVVAAHPYDGSPQPSSSRLTQRFAYDEALRGLVHRFELFNRTQLFGWVADSALPAIATGDFHRAEHLTGWKTLVPAAADEEAVVAYLRSRRPVYLARLEADDAALAA
jgi:predicted metal-dependent phosphoesterase TrpH